MLPQTITRSSSQRKQTPDRFIMLSPDLSRVFELDREDTKEVLAFLSIRPVHTVVMTSFINDNGIRSELNRGTFYGYRNSAGELEGVALIGHSTLVEARTEDALEALAFRARNTATPIHLIMSSGNDAERFHRFLTGGAASPRLTCTEALFEAAFPFVVQSCEYRIAEADISQLEQIASAQAEVAFIECGVDPMVKDREGFIKRVERRIGQNRVFTVFEDGKLIFKADIIAETGQAIYLEGVYVHPEYRGKGVGSRCMAALTRKLLERADNICLLSNVEFTSAHRTFEKAGYRQTDQCVTIFV